MRFDRQFRYIYLRIIRFKGHPHELALGMAIGVFIGMTPTVPFHIILAITLALAFKASKITAVLGTWICNPLTVYPLYKYSYKTGSFILGFNHNKKFLSPVVEAINSGEFLDILTTILGGGGMVVATFLTGGIVLGVLIAAPSYGISLHFFRAFISWRKSKKVIKKG